ncbi:MAG: hypothetical protein ACOC1F_05740, partial [Myxococcota bacterium]
DQGPRARAPCRPKLGRPRSARRLMEAQHRTGDDAAAQRSARQYLRQFPSGGHAALARDLVGE